LELDGVYLGQDQVLGDVCGFAVAMETLGLFRPSVGAFAAGMAQSAPDAAVEHLRNREDFGHPLRRCTRSPTDLPVSRPNSKERGCWSITQHRKQMRKEQMHSRPRWRSCSQPRLRKL